MNANGSAIQIIPDLTIDDKYSAIIEAAHQRIRSFTENALKDGRLGELFVLKKTPIDATAAVRVPGRRRPAHGRFPVRSPV